ncbi:DUF3667 domain-containing protein [Maribacter cobaltidurans]|uniref:Uncharacterized protein n=1 Tax=Maribacter cobaltidurans TaxID=1178778 RepID=A0A223V885_9FLAO|nr:DUF3667 domain-containing protein [Maribacter cobaltidurans]ASV31198.1 hypothetical protein CJ263_13795 [Maribacter cobaltidurans]GGD84286.1 hypothetical protein GCM10011412_22570 [Maribacter cobaltidurans]
METKPSVNTTGRYQLRYRGVECLNCGHPLDISDKYCPNCSQANSTKKLTLKDFFEEFFSNIISYDSKLFRTLGSLLLRPGRITKAYISGQRVSYTNPFRFLLSLAIIYFLLIGLSGDLERLDRFGTGPNELPINFSGSMVEDLDFGNSQEDKAQVMAELDSLELNDLISEKIKVRDSIIMADPKKQLIAASEKTFFGSLIRKQEIFGTLIQKDTLYVFDDAKNKYLLDDNWHNRTSFNMARSIIRVKRQPGAYLNSVLSKLPFTTFFYLPVFTIFIWLVYIRKKYTYTDHLIFSFHNQSLFFILLIISYLIDSVFGIDTSGIFILIFAIYLYKAMRNFYDQGRFKTIVKYIFLNTIFVILAIMGAALLFAGSMFTY